MRWRSVTCFLAAGALAGQQELPTIKVDVDLVNVLFSVRDKRNALVGNLAKDDFAVFEDGKEQQTRYFARESDLPLTLGLLVDVSPSQVRLIEEEKVAAHKFFSGVLRPKDMAFLISFGPEAELLQDFTNSAKLLRAGLDQLRVRGGGGGVHPGPVPTISKPKGTVLFDAVYLAAAEKLRREVGRKAVVLITDGVDYGSHYSREDAIAEAHKSDAIIYSIYFFDYGFYSRGGGFAPGDGDLRRMSEQTGGRLFHVDRRNSLEEVFRQIQEEMRSQYAIAYSSSNPVKDGGFRKIEIRPRDRTLKVQSRKGYFAAPQT